VYKRSALTHIHEILIHFFVTVIDQVSFSPSLTIPQQSIGVANQSQGFEGVDGVLGLGPSDLTIGTVSNQTVIPTVTDNLSSLGVIAGDSIGVSFSPTTSVDGTPQMNGNITFGTTDPNSFIPPITFVPITSVAPSSDFFGISQSITYGTAGLQIMSSTFGIVDSGQTMLLIPSGEDFDNML